MRNPQGYATWVGPRDAIPAGSLGDTTECDTFTCFHCNHVKFVSPREDPSEIGGMCKICMKLICASCVDLIVCTPYEERLNKLEAKERFLQAAGIRD